MSASLYDRDYLAWTEDQAAALRRVEEMRINVPGLDLARLAEEVEDMGNGTLDKIEGLIAQIILHLLKLEYSPEEAPRRHWRAEIAAWRATVRRRARRSPTALDKLDIAELTRDAARQLQLRYGKASWAAECPSDGTYSMAEILDDGWEPMSRHGLPAED